MLFITFVALLNVCLAFNITTEDSGNKKTLCCATARQQCADKCSGQLCTETCEARCGLFNTNCGSWVCQDIAGFSCTPTTTQAPITAAACVASGDICAQPGVLTGILTCCSGTCNAYDATLPGYRCA
eukprot:TRINITY_DN3010_c0_g1_i1.p1 TRINITY_DN3010_c0_g1~~TRINITY_DN3010_c0_g1_i1.p1  ORF type:complete len:127 (-),score=25.30 TRINITY_DN3010_c0_g1_i1:130-510(-)